MRSILVLFLALVAVHASSDTVVCSGDSNLSGVSVLIDPYPLEPGSTAHLSVTATC